MEKCKHGSWRSVGSGMVECGQCAKRFKEVEWLHGQIKERDKQIEWLNNIIRTMVKETEATSHCGNCESCAYKKEIIEAEEFLRLTHPKEEGA